MANPNPKNPPPRPRGPMKNPPKKRTTAELLAFWLDRSIINALRHGIVCIGKDGAPLTDGDGNPVRRPAGADVITAAIRRIEQIRTSEPDRPVVPALTPPEGWRPPSRRTA